MEPNKRAPRRPDVLFNAALSCVLLGGSLGGFMACLNAWASPYYFQLLMGWGKEEVLMGSLIKGITGGMVYGSAFAAFFVIVCGWATKFSCSFPFAFWQLAKAGALTLLGWAWAACWSSLLTGWIREIPLRECRLFLLKQAPVMSIRPPSGYMGSSTARKWAIS